MRLLNGVTAHEFLQRQGLALAKIEEVLSGFDLALPIYEHDLWPGDLLYQLVRRPSALDPFGTTGNWFGIAGITTAGVAINDGLSGRELVSFEVVLPFTALEGTARALPINVGTGIGGVGGATQLFIPRAQLGHLRSAGPAARW